MKADRIPEIEQSKRNLKEWITAAITLQDITVKMHKSKDMAEAMDAIIEATTKLLKVEYASIILVDLKNRKFLKSATNDPTRPKNSTWQYLRKNGLTFYVASRHEMVSIDDTSKHALATNPILKDLNIKSLLAVPVVSGDKVLGVFYALTSKQREFDRFDQHLARNLAAHAATAIQNIRFKTELERLARQDSLTKLLNRRAFMERLLHETHRFSRYRQKFALAIIDLDNLKGVNDTMGHQMGDFYIETFARALNKTLRKSDATGRIGGDEFAAIILKPDETKLYDLFVRIQKNWEQNAGILNRKPSFSAGIFVVDDAETDIKSEHIFKKADKELYNAKRNGRSSISMQGNITSLTS